MKRAPLIPAPLPSNVIIVEPGDLMAAIWEVEARGDYVFRLEPLRNGGGPYGVWRLTTAPDSGKNPVAGQQEAKAGHSSD